MNYVSIKLSYKASGLYGINKLDLDNLSDELRKNYISYITSNPGPQAGGLVDAFVEVLLDTSFVDFFKVLRDGFIFDTVTRGGKSFLLKPLFDAFRKIEVNNEYWDYSCVQFFFNSTKITIYGTNKMFTSRLAMVFDSLAKHYKDLGEPYEIVIPITKETTSGDNSTYMSYQGNDFDIIDYGKYWGISDNSGYDRKIYDVKKSIFINESWE